MVVKEDGMQVVEVMVEEKAREVEEEVVVLQSEVPMVVDNFFLYEYIKREKVKGNTVVFGQNAILLCSQGT